MKISAPVEAFHAGVPCVVTPYGGHSEYARHLENSIVTGFGDPAGVAGFLLRGSVPEPFTLYASIRALPVSPGDAIST